MKHRSYRGRLVYLTNGVGEMGREWFSVTIQPDGTRTLRAQCEMDDDRLLRDVVLTCDGGWRPLDAFVRLAVDERTVGTGWFRFDGPVAESEGWTAERGRFSQRIELDASADFLGTHALHGDAWTAGRFRLHRGPASTFAFVTFAVSTLANGGSGPELIPVPADFAQITDHGIETVTTGIGPLAAHHLRVDVPGVDYFDIWAAGDDCIPARLTSDGLNQTYELVALEGDWR